MILNAPENDIETKAVANMVRYIKEARDLLGLENGTKFDELIDAHLDDYKSKDEYDDLDVDYSELSGVAVSFVVDKTNAGYRINLPGEKFANAVVKVNYLNGEEISLVKSETENIWHTNTTKVYDIVNKAIEITVTIPGEDGDTVVRGTYSVGAYIQATDNDMAKAMYEFGVAAKVYREWLQTK